ncbi:S9 family peptidase [Halobacillus salinarum]|uniref:S9 family peptidase n=1 Tax=Halobacillus salinarum TaxID=2932257 RepID=A0ABY4EQQ3_9BACI|nr:S9 family peptidase [Halobacillus salinarum]UOQ45974.1 S9 family peptidase [Halobacillus salinarum]
MMNGANYLSIEEVISIPKFMETAISDDGRYAAYVKQTADWEENAYVNHVWLYNREAGKSYPLTIGKNESTQPRFSPDSKYLACIGVSGEGENRKKEIYIQTLGDTHAYQASPDCYSIEEFKWSPDSKGIYFKARRLESESLKKRKEMYGEFYYVDKDFEYEALYFLNLETGGKELYDPLPHGKMTPAVEPLTEQMDLQIHSYDISFDCKHIVFSAAPTPRAVDSMDQELYILHRTTKEIDKVDASPLQAGEVLFSPGGTRLCYTCYEKEKAIYNNRTIEIYDLETQRTIRPVQDIDEHIIPVRWTPNGILISWQEKTNFLAGIVSETGKITSLVSKEDMVASAPSITWDQSTFVCVKQTSTTPAEVYINHEPITSRSVAYKGKIQSEKEVVTWRTEDGLEIEGVLSKPVDFADSKSYPLIVAVHGGPAGTSFAVPTTNKYQPIESFIAKGFLVLEPNYRGSTGYGQAFRKANYRYLGLGDYEDVVSGVDSLIEKGYVDAERVGILGWSQGGYISALCATYSTRFKAVSVGAGISNWITYYANTDITHFTRFYLGSDPWTDEEIYRKTSPMTYINNACTPTLIQHGEKDGRVPLPNAFELYRGLKDRGVPAELVLFKEMKHSSHQPGLNRAILKQNLHWFCHYLLDEPFQFV